MVSPQIQLPEDKIKDLCDPTKKPLGTFVALLSVIANRSNRVKCKLRSQFNSKKHDQTARR